MVTQKPEYMQVVDSFSGTAKDQNGDPVPVTLNKGQIFAANHKYVKQWPHHFTPFSTEGQVVVSQ